MRYASEDLMNEHEGILLGLTILEKMANMVKESKEVDNRDIHEMANFLRLFADKCHHGKEEGLMFPALEKFGVPNKGGPIGQMLLEHDEGRSYIAQIGDSTAGGVLKAGQFTEAAENYVGLMRAHIAKENNVLFPLGDRVLPADVQEQLLMKFEEFEEEVMGEDTHEKLHHLLHDFKEKYLK